MKKGIIAMILGAIFIVSIAAVYAIGGYAGGQGTSQTGQFTDVNTMAARHTQMEQIFENGTYADLQAYRTDSGFNMMPWVVDQATFEQAKERFAVMDKYHEQNGFGTQAVRGMMQGRSGQGVGSGQGGCPMRNYN